MRRLTLCLLVIALIATAQAQTLSPTTLEVVVDPSLTENFLIKNLSKSDDTAYNEYVGLMSKAARGEEFGLLEPEVRKNAQKTGDNRKAELARMVLELRNLALRVQRLEQQKTQQQSNE